MVGRIGTGEGQAASRAREIRSRLEHPIVDADGHLIESVPLLLNYVERGSGTKAVERLLEWFPRLFTGAGDAERAEARGPWWPHPADALEQATCMAPGLLAERLEEIGIDFTILYPSLGIILCTIFDDEVRRKAVRAVNTMNAELCAPYRDRMTPAAAIPMYDPSEAVEELEFAVGRLGSKAAMIPAAVARPVPAHPEAFPAFSRMDRFGLDSAHDYDPVWRAFCRSKVAVTAHGGIGFRYLPAGRSSPSNYVFNHMLGHSYLQAELCRSLLLGGVPSRFPSLRFAFLEGGVNWAAELLQSVVEHWEKRGPRGLGAYDPSRLDREQLNQLLVRYGLPVQPPQLFEVLYAVPWARDEFAESGIRGEQDLIRVFGEQFFFGCASDDRLLPGEPDGGGSALGVALRPVFSSDIGHWDVPRLAEVVPQSWEPVESRIFSEGAYRRFVFENPVRLHAEMNPEFFAETRVAEAARRLQVEGGAR